MRRHKKYFSRMPRRHIEYVFRRLGFWLPQYRNILSEIIITERSGQDLTDYQVRIELDENWKGWSIVSKNKDSMFFIDDNGQPLYFWIESFDSTNKQAVIWVKIPSIPASSSITVYLCHSISNPYRNYNNPEQVFLVFDDFTVDKGYVNVGPGSGTYSISNSVLYMKQTSAGRGFDYALKIADFDLTAYSSGTLIIEARVKCPEEYEYHVFVFRTAMYDDLPYNAYKFYGTQKVGADVGLYDADKNIVVLVIGKLYMR